MRWWLAILLLAFFTSSALAGTGTARVTIGTGPTLQEARVPVYITFPNTNTGETHIDMWQLVFELNGATFLSFEFPQSEPQAIVNQFPPCGGILVQLPYSCSLQGLVGWLHVESVLPVALSIVALDQCGGQWYSQVVSSNAACSLIAFYPYSSFEVVPGVLDDSVDSPVRTGPTWAAIKALYQ